MLTRMTISIDLQPTRPLGLPIFEFYAIMLERYRKTLLKSISYRNSLGTRSNTHKLRRH
jgi:hypothetical protein